MTRTAEADRPRAARPGLTWRQRRHYADFKYSPYLYVAPFFILFALVGLFPLLYTFVVSLNDWDLLKGQGQVWGFQNYIREFQDPGFWNSIFNTFSIFLLSAIPQLVAATFIAAVLDQNLRAKTFWRLSVLLPYVVTPAAVALIFSSIFSETYGLVNNLLTSIGLDPVLWKHDTFAGHFAIATMVNWRWTGYNALILLAAMQAVPRDIYESAALDGAGAFRRFFSMTLPSIRPTFIFVLITATIGGLQIFTEPKLFEATLAYPGGVYHQFETTTLYIWNMAFNQDHFGRAAAIAFILLMIIVLIGLINYFLSRGIASSEAKMTKTRTSRRLAKYRATQQDAVPPVAQNHLERLP
ncbi:MAG: sugar ABC transporter permease [Pseudolysinimonas sp.]|uniref:carbohydrate ABC transporter permease n=1 Tax=Pseudolysinimonas sp. TaxID=2680009 RepID=UPI00326610A7